MPYQKNRVNDVIAVLSITRVKFNRKTYYRNSTELRKEAVKEVAEFELRIKRYKNEDSALKTIHDACARRLKPDIKTIKDFDELVN
jgi:hypothetical protein